jgi:hypothetical protein
MRRFLSVLVLILLLSACQSNQAVDLTPAEILLRSSQRLQSLGGFHVSLLRTGAPAYLDTGGTLSFSRLDGNYVAPDSIQAKVKVVTPGIVVEVDVISIARVQWQTNPITGQWEQLPEDWGFNPASLFEAQSGLPAILISDLSDLQVSKGELDEMPGKVFYLLTARLGGKNLYTLSNGLIGPGDMDAQIWIDPQTFDLHRVLLIEYAQDAELERTWQIDFWDFNKVIDIQAPLNQP